MTKVHTFPPARIMLATDLSETSRAATSFARLLRESYGGEVRAVHAHYFELPPYFASGQMEALTRELTRSRRLATEYLRREIGRDLGSGVEVSISEKPPAEAVLEAAAGYDANLIVMGTHGRRGAERLWLGSVAESVLRNSSRPVLAVRPAAEPRPFRRILCPVKFSDAGRAALDYAAQVAGASRAKLEVLHAVEPGEPPLDCPLVGEDIRRHCSVEEAVLQGNAAKTILEAVHRNSPDLIVMGADHKTSVFGGLFSSTTQKVMQSAPVPILVVPVV